MLLDHRPSKVILPSLILLFTLSASHTYCQTERTATGKDDIHFADLFKVDILNWEGETYLNTGPDSLKTDTTCGLLRTALWNFHGYLFSNYADAMRHNNTLLAFLPDTAALREKFNALLHADTAFQRIYLRSIHRDMVAPLDLDSALRIAAHFFYLHRMGEDVTMHVCVGINKVQTLSTSPAHPYHAAFCYMTIWGMEDFMTVFRNRIEPIRTELKEKNLSDERLLELEQAVYDMMASDPELRKALLNEYDKKAQYLNFELMK